MRQTHSARAMHNVISSIEEVVTSAHMTNTLTATMTPSELPAWNLESEYPSHDSLEFSQDVAKVEENIQKIQTLVHALRSESDTKTAVALLQTIASLDDEAFTTWVSVRNFVSCECAVDATHSSAQRKLDELQQLGSKLGQSLTAVSHYLARADESVVTAYLDHPGTAPRAFSIRKTRENRDLLLSETEENLVTALTLNGPAAWGSLYNSLSGRMKCDVELKTGRETMGLAKATGLLKGSDEPTRKAAWVAINSAWSTHQESAAAILNSLAGWRLEMCERRSHTRKIDFLTTPLHKEMISRGTLEAMMSAVHEHRPRAQKALRTMAEGMGKTKLDPWDTMAAAPPARTVDKPRTFEEGFELIRDAFMKVDSEFGAFCDVMKKNGWMEARVLSNKRNGAFCTSFAKSRTPRVFLTYLGSLSDVRTLAHELGHAYHCWVQRDLPLHHRDSPMTLAETASVFAETALADHLLNSGDEATRREVEWQNNELVAAFLINIPVRFEFEKSFYERRKSAPLSPAELSEIMSETWMRWYGDTMNEPDPMFWASKLHFAIANTSFYNFPYTFGYLFSRGLYNRRKAEGPSFMKTYVDILKETGQRSAEDLIQKYLGEDIRKPDFWRHALEV